MTDFGRLDGTAVLRPPGVWDSTSGRCLAEGSQVFGILSYSSSYRGAGALGLLFVLVLLAPLLVTSVDRFRDDGREKKPCIPVVLERTFGPFARALSCRWLSL
jgi:hypothetical protein